MRSELSFQKVWCPSTGTRSSAASERTSKPLLTMVAGDSFKMTRKTEPKKAKTVKIKRTQSSRMWSRKNQKTKVNSLRTRWIPTPTTMTLNRPVTRRRTKAKTGIRWRRMPTKRIGKPLLEDSKIMRTREEAAAVVAPESKEDEEPLYANNLLQL